jgi:hypothetical protein
MSAREGLSDVVLGAGEAMRRWNVTESLFTENQVDKLPALVAELISHQMAVIFATGGAAPLFAARAATARIRFRSDKGE